MINEQEQALPEVPEIYFCPITHQIMLDPVVTEIGSTYERSAIERWIISYHGNNVIDPSTNRPLLHHNLTSNLALRGGILEFLDANRNYLYLAVERNYSVLVNALATRFPQDIGVPDANGRTLLHVAAMLGSAEIVHTFISLLNRAQIDIDVRDAQGNTPLHLAARSNRGNVALLLLNAGANHRLRNSRGFKATEEARYNGHIDTLELIERRIAAIKQIPLNEVLEQVERQGVENTELEGRLSIEIRHRNAAITDLQRQVGNRAQLIEPGRDLLNKIIKEERERIAVDAHNRGTERITTNPTITSILTWKDTVNSKLCEIERNLTAEERKRIDGDKLLIENIFNNINRERLERRTGIEYAANVYNAHAEASHNSARFMVDTKRLYDGGDAQEHSVTRPRYPFG